MPTARLASVTFCDAGDLDHRPARLAPPDQAAAEAAAADRVVAPGHRERLATRRSARSAGRRSRRWPACRAASIAAWIAAVSSVCAIALGAEVAHRIEDLARHRGRVAEEPLLGRRDHAAAAGPAGSRRAGAAGAVCTRRSTASGRLLLTHQLLRRLDQPAPAAGRTAAG